MHSWVRADDEDEDEHYDEVSGFGFTCEGEAFRLGEFSIMSCGRRLGPRWAFLSFIALGLLSPWRLGRTAEPAAAADSDGTAIALQALSRLKGVDLDTNPALKSVVTNVLAQIHDQPEFIELVRQFHIKDQDQALLEYATKHPVTAAGIDAVKLIIENGNTDLLKRAVQSTNRAAAKGLLEAMGNTGESQLVPLLETALLDPKCDTESRKQVVRSLAKTQDGAATLLKLAKEDKLSFEVRLLSSMELTAVRWPAIKAQAAQVIPLPQGQNSEPLPPIAQLVKLKGDAERGEEVFSRDTVGCVKCHTVNGKGVDVGPNLSEIGTKLGKEALYESILDPSAGISFGYEAYQIELKNGDEAFGLIVSETPEELAVKAQTGIVTRFKKSEIAEKTQQKTSIMPAGLQMAMSTQDLVDLVEFLSSLKKAGG